MINNIWTCFGNKSHKFYNEEEYLDHIKKCEFTKRVRKVFLCKFFDLHIFRSLKNKNLHEVNC